MDVLCNSKAYCCVHVASEITVNVDDVYKSQWGNALLYVARCLTNGLQKYLSPFSLTDISQGSVRTHVTTINSLCVLGDIHKCRHIPFFKSVQMEGGGQGLHINFFNVGRIWNYCCLKSHTRSWHGAVIHSNNFVENNVHGMVL